MRILLFALSLIFVFPCISKSEKQELIKSAKGYLVRLECHELSKNALSSRYRVQTGVVIGKDLVLTSLNFVNDSSVVNVFKYSTRERYGSGLIWKDSSNNVAIFKVPKLNATPISMNRSENLSQIDEIMIFNCGRRDSIYMESTWGILSGSPKDTIITVGAAVNPGGIGAPVITLDGKLAGVIVDKEVSLFAEGMAYMANIDLIHEAIREINEDSEPLGAIKEFETLDYLGMAFENEMKSYDTKRIKKKIAFLEETYDLVNKAMKNTKTNIIPAYFKTYLYKRYFDALASDYKEAVAMKIYDEYVENALQVRKIVFDEKYPNGDIPEEELSQLTKESFDPISIAADKARMRIVEYGLNDIKVGIRKADFYGYLFYGTMPILFKNILKD